MASTPALISIVLTVMQYWLRIMLLFFQALYFSYKQPLKRKRPAAAELTTTETIPKTEACTCGYTACNSNTQPNQPSPPKKTQTVVYETKLILLLIDIVDF